MRSVGAPRASASLASCVAVTVRVVVVVVVVVVVGVGEAPPVPAAVPPLAGAAVAAPAAGANARAAAATTAKRRFRALTSGNRRHDRPRATRARRRCTALLRRSFSEQVCLPEIVPPHPAAAGALVMRLRS